MYPFLVGSEPETWKEQKFYELNFTPGGRRDEEEKFMEHKLDDSSRKASYLYNTIINLFSQAATDLGEIKKGIAN